MTKVTTEEIKRRLDAGEDITIIDSRSDKAWSESDTKAGGAIRIPPDEARLTLPTSAVTGLPLRTVPDPRSIRAPVWRSRSKNMDSTMYIR